MNPSALKNLTLASAKHLMTQGHISPGSHKKIVKKVKAAGHQQPMPQPTPPPMEPPAAPSFGALDGGMGMGAGAPGAGGM